MNIIQIILHNTIFGSIHLMNQIWDLWVISDDFSDVITAYLRKMGLKSCYKVYHMMYHLILKRLFFPNRFLTFRDHFSYCGQYDTAPNPGQLRHYSSTVHKSGSKTERKNTDYKMYQR